MTARRSPLRNRAPKLAALVTSVAAAAFAMGGTGRCADRSEPYRPQVHFTPLRNWMNDPNGLIWEGGEYHLFYQYNPQGNVWGHMSWGHAVSPDLLHWRELPLAIPEDDRAMIYSGSVVLDRENTTGFGAPGKPPLVAVYTSAAQPPAERQTQSIAFSLDHGRTWTKYAGNPVLDLGLKDFRDPKVFWYAPQRSWIMVAARSTDHKVSFFASGDLKTWRHLSDFGPAGASDGVWECPDLFPLPEPGPGRRLKWVLKVDVQNSALAPGGGGQVFIGTFDGARFRAERTAKGSPQPQWLDYGPDYYASGTWTDAPGGRRVMIGWMDNWRYAQEEPTGAWRGAMSLPRVLSLGRGRSGLTLLQAPVAELRTLSGRTVEQSKLVVPDGGVETLPLDPAGGAFDLRFRLWPQKARSAGVSLMSSAGVEAQIGYDAIAGRLYLERPASGPAAFASKFGARVEMPVALSSGALPLRIVVDRSSVEVFAEGGAKVMTARLYPRAPLSGVAAYAKAGSALMTSLNVTPLRSAGGDGSPE
jgi:fructan beta-fructosidase